MFNQEDEVNEVDIEKLLNINLNDLNKLKVKQQKVIYFVSNSNENDTVKNEVIQKLTIKLEEIKNIEENLNKISINFDKINEISYNENITTIYFH